MASTFFQCHSFGGSQFCNNQYSPPSESACLICTALCERALGLGIETGMGILTLGNAAVNAASDALLPELSEPLNVIEEESRDSDRNLLSSPYANNKNVTKMNCKFSKYGCRKNVQGKSLYEKHIKKCSYR